VAPAILWFRRDLRLDDLPALTAPAGAGADGVVPLFVVDPSVLRAAGPNRRRFLAERSVRSIESWTERWCCAVATRANWSRPSPRRSVPR
jgi:deoxyribodipyrimidine photo-lyase